MATREEIIANANPTGATSRYDGLYDIEEEDFQANAAEKHQENSEEEGADFFDNYSSQRKDEAEADELEIEVISKDKLPKSKDEIPYQNPLVKPIYTAGNISIGISHAKLFGIEIDDNGNLLTKKSTNANSRTKSQILQKAQEISKPRDFDPDLIAPDESERVENEKREALKRQAQQAMRNPRCGYDFVDRLNDRGSFLDRLHSSDAVANVTKVSDAEKEDYDARLDKLACPKCNRTQTFDEFIEKKRFCSLCKEKFTKATTSNTAAFERRMQDREAKKAERLKKIEDEMYGGPVKPAVVVVKKVNLPVGVTPSRAPTQAVSVPVPIDVVDNILRTQESNARRLREVASEIEAKYSKSASVSSSAAVLGKPPFRGQDITRKLNATTGMRGKRGSGASPGGSVASDSSGVALDKFDSLVEYDTVQALDVIN